MINETQLTLYQGEARLLTIKVFQINEKQQLRPFKPLEATIKVLNNDTSESVLSETAAGIGGDDENKVYYLITSNNVTNNVGEFKIIWKMARGSEIFYHKTFLELREL